MQALNPTASRCEAVLRYFEYVDAGDIRLIDLFTDDAELYFPKFGFARGKLEMGVFAQRMAAMVRWLRHETQGFRIIGSGDLVVVEGRESGAMADGTQFPDGVVSLGMFCNVFEFRDELIKAVRIYADPDFPSRDTERIRALSRQANQH